MGVNTWLMKGFFDTIPTELDESARVDGATPAQIFWGVVLPLAAPVLAVVALISFIFTLNEFVIAQRAAADDRQVHARRSGCTSFIDQTSTARAGARSRPASLLAAIPVALLFLVPAEVHRQRPDRRARSRDEHSEREPRRRCSPSRTTTARSSSSLERPTSSATRRSSALRVPRAARPTRSCSATSTTASRARSTRELDERDGRRDLVARALPGREPGDALPLAARGRRRPATRG